ncbi:hypothetical protein MOQ72_20335 [Saccharopolyspora sp. K220]|uniref:hypothetical protein n=1 Tax=Saccharopolyspora soli TaxID=2926618 RepID=UPI001F5A6033|nr:hypothetical protein [Saccharopolyspora soli]MCI2419799.1 hypothetical protein [Saccharopolyspora soli]
MNEALSRLLGRSNRPDLDRAERAGEIAELVRVTLGLPENSTVTVQELACAEPGCPPMETKIAVLDQTARRWTLHAQLSEVDDEAVRKALTTQPEGENASR